MVCISTEVPFLVLALLYSYFFLLPIPVVLQLLKDNPALVRHKPSQLLQKSSLFKKACSP